MPLVKEYYKIVGTNRRITIPKDFQPGEPIKVRIERVIKDK
jgi:hypothetical protein